LEKFQDYLQGIGQLSQDLYCMEEIALERILLDQIPLEQTVQRIILEYVHSTIDETVLEALYNLEDVYLEEKIEENKIKFRLLKNKIRIK